MKNTLAFLSTLYAGYPDAARLEIRSFTPSDRPGPRRWFPLTEAGFTDAASFGQGIADTVNVYLGVLPRTDRGGKASDVRLCNALWCDIDAGESDFDATLALLKDATNRGLPVPHLLVRSGGGLHCYWILSKSAPCRTSEEQAVVARTLRRLVLHVGGELSLAHACPKATDIARVLRLPGTFNLKGEEPRPVQVLRVAPPDAPRWSLWEWRAFLPAEPAPVHRPAYRESRPSFNPLSPPPRIQTRLVSGEPNGRKHYGIVDTVTWARKAGHDEAAILTFAEMVAQASGVPVSDPSQRRHLEQAVAWAMQNVQPDLVGAI